MFRREAYVVAVLNGHILIKRLINRNRWYFPGGSLGIFENTIDFLNDIVSCEIDGIKVKDRHFLGILFHNWQFVSVYVFECTGSPDRHCGIEAASFIEDPRSYMISSLGRKILKLYHRYTISEPNLRPIL